LKLSCFEYPYVTVWVKIGTHDAFSVISLMAAL